MSERGQLRRQAERATEQVRKWPASMQKAASLLPTAPKPQAVQAPVEPVSQKHRA
jgi:hypothetical protein